MATKEDSRLQAEQALYADLMERLVRLSLILVGVGFAVYLAGLLPYAVPAAEVPGRWGLSLPEYLLLSGAERGRWCLACRRGGDYLNFGSIFLLNLVPVICYLRLLPLLARRGDRSLFIFAALQVAVLLLAASGRLVVR